MFEIQKFNELALIDLYAILKERTEVFVVEQNCPYLEIDGKDVDSYHIFTKINGDIAAYARILPPGVSYKQASIGRVLVKKQYRKDGLGRKLMEQAIQFILDELKEDEIKIQAQHYLNDFYSSLGFKNVSEVYLEDNIPHVDMILKQINE